MSVVLAPVVALILAITLAQPVAAAAGGEPGRPKASHNERKVAGKDIKVRPRKHDPAAKKLKPARVEWPEPGSAEVSVPLQGSRPGRPAAARAGKLPVWVLPAGQAEQEGRNPGQAGHEARRVEVRMLGRKTSGETRAQGVAFSLARTDQRAAGRAGVRLDYSGFAQAIGGAYGARLRLVQLPACAATTPQRPECQQATPLRTINNAADKTLTAELDIAPRSAAATSPGATVLAAEAEPAGSQGDYTATKLEPSSKWSAGGSSGNFSWSYPMGVPPVPGALEPTVQVSYSSQSVDGKTSNTSGQPSWLGQGFELWPGFIERSYKACADDGAPKDEWGNKPGDRCWGTDNATISWNGKGGELIKSGSAWRFKNDDGTKVEKLTGASNGDNDGEYWRITTTDGTRYYFGKNRLPGWSSGNPETDSAWSAPVFGNNSGEPCHKSSGFKDSWCQQAWRWNLDYVVDPEGNAISYSYGQETNYYARNLEPKDGTKYTRGGYLKSISYGLRSSDMFATAPAQVKFSVSQRCLASAADCASGEIKDHPQRWPDVPWDLNCAEDVECAKRDEIGERAKGAVSPTFWSRYRLTKVTAQVVKADGSGHRDVDSWALNHRWGEASTERDLLLTDIQRTGHTASPAVTLPKVSFNHVQLPNRVDKIGDDILPYLRYRVDAITDESGGQTDVVYSDTDCKAGQTPSPASNTRRCYPVKWEPPGRDDPETDWFHKYVVTQVKQTDLTGWAPAQVTQYGYHGGAAWRFADDDGLTKRKRKTWSQWRGYGRVSVKTGSLQNPAAQSDTVYMRGMDGDRESNDGGTKDVSVSDGEGGTYKDHDALAGFSLKTVQYTRPGGSVHAKTVNTPWRVRTASDTREWGTVTANVVKIDTTRSWKVKDGGGWTETKTDNDYVKSGAGIGRVTEADDHGDVTNGDDDRCVRTSYADDTAKHMVSFVSRTETVAVRCGASPDRAKQLISDVRSSYDGGAYGTAPTRGNVTQTDQAASHDGTKAAYVVKERKTYDSYGRETKITDAEGGEKTKSYADTRGLAAGLRTTMPVAGEGAAPLTTAEVLDPARGLPVKKTDVANNLVTQLEYDALGRLRKVWQPDRHISLIPNLEFSYQVTEDKIVAITTKKLTSGGGQRASVEIFDGWLRSRQTQKPGPDGRLITDTFYDERGLKTITYDTYSAAGKPAPALFGVEKPGLVETQTAYSYDGLGRETVKRLMHGNGEQDAAEISRTTTTYGGAETTTVTPPSGGTVTTQITDARGQVTERRHRTGEDSDQATKYAYTPAGKLGKITDPAGNIWEHIYDLRGRKVTEKDPDKGTTSYTYDNMDRIISATDARGKKIVHAYDGLGRKTATREGSAAGTLLASWAYDGVRNGKGKLASATRYVSGNAYVSAIGKYDMQGRATSKTVTIPGSEGGLAGSYRMSKSYDLDGTLSGQTMPAVGGLDSDNVAHTYDDYQRPVRMVSNDDRTFVNEALYTPTGKLMRTELGAAKRVTNSYTYEGGTQRLATSRTYRENVSGDERYARYGYDPAGNITSISDTVRGVTDTQCFGYDPLRRLTEAWTHGTTTCDSAPSGGKIGGSAPYWHSYGYDKAGNRTKQTSHGLAGADDTVSDFAYADGQGNRLTGTQHEGPGGERTDTYGYDETGNTTGRTIDGKDQRLQWGAEGELSKVTGHDGQTTSFIYDADGQRLLRKDPGGTTLYLPGTEVRLEKITGTAKATRYYTFGDQIVAIRTPDKMIYLGSDHHGTAQTTVDAATQETATRRQDPFGVPRGQTAGSWPAAMDKGFVGGTMDPTGLTHLGARLYDPAAGRFISVDPELNPDEPQQMNGYNYASNNPVTLSDPSGQQPCGPQTAGDPCGVSGHSGVTPTNTSNYPVSNGWGTYHSPPGIFSQNQLPPPMPSYWYLLNHPQIPHRPVDVTLTDGQDDPRTTAEHERHGSKNKWLFILSKEGAQALAGYAFLTDGACKTGLSLTCALWKHYLKGGGKEKQLGVGGLLSDLGFRSDVNSVLHDIRKAMARNSACGNRSCTFDSKWQGATFTSMDGSLALGHGMFRIRGATRSGRTGNFSISFYKDWNFDPGESAFGIPFKPFYKMHVHGIAHEYAVTGNFNFYHSPLSTG